jgi:3-hydroxybutyryl-CoA dehydrogenase
VIEVIIEDEIAKLELFSQLDKVVQPSGILATNTSSIPIINLAAATTRGDQVLGMHFLNPAPVQPLVELVRSRQTSDATLEIVGALAAGPLGKNVIGCRDRAGFVVNRLLVPYLLAAIRMHDEGVSREDIDDGMKYGCGHPMGPLTLCDLIGLDTIKSVAQVLYDEFKDPSYAPPPLLMRMVSANELGRKTGKGFYDYT